MSDTKGSQVIAAVRKAAEANPTKAFRKGSGCRYVAQRKGELVPCCLIGHGLWEVGLLSGSVYRKPENTKVFEYIIGALGLVRDFTSDQIRWLNKAQREQDDGRTWAEAVAEADNRYGVIT